MTFSLSVAGPGKRGIAFLLDTLIKFGVVAVAGIIVGIISEYRGGLSGVGTGMVLVIWFSMSWLYGSCCEAFWNGQTIGKKAQNLRVVRTNGTPIGWFEAFGRNLLLVADGMLILGPLALNTVGLLSMAATKRLQRLGDLVFDTMVIDESREFISRFPEVTHGVEPLRRSECTGRYHVPERTLAVIERLFEGDRIISDGRREEIARTLSAVLRKRLGFEEAGPDPTNPNTYFTQTPLKHTTFLKRVLKTFAEDSSETGASEEQPQTSAGVKPIRGIASATDLDDGARIESGTHTPATADQPDDALPRSFTESERAETTRVGASTSDGSPS